VYCKKYIGKLEVEKLPTGFAAKFWIDRNNPNVIAADLTDPEDFLKYLEKELKVNRWHYSQYTSSYML
jgi:hypothetical protein